MDNIFDIINAEITPDELERRGFIERGKKSGWICLNYPDCKNGRGKDGTGMNRVPGTNILKCHVCGKSYSPVDVIASAHGFNPATKEGQHFTAEKTKEIFNMSDSDFYFSNEKNSAAPKGKQTQKETESKNYLRMYAYARSQLEGFIKLVGGSWRGFTLEDLRKAGAGYLPPKDGQKGKIIFPYDEYHYFEREVDGSGKRFIKGNRILYRPDSIKVDGLNFLVEGEIDALSIDKVLNGFCGATATGGAGELDMVIRELNKIFKGTGKKPKFIIMFDKDSAGEQGATKLLAALNAAGYLAVSAFLSPEKIDSNDFMQKDSTGFIRRLLDIAEENERILDEIVAVQKGEEEGIQFGNFFSYMFNRQVTEFVKYSDRKTGFENLDVNHQTITPGLYLLGGLPALGKTSFAWQLAEQMARRGENCIYCSYEMSALELFSKSVARGLYQKTGKREISSFEIRRGEFSPDSTELINNFAAESFDLRVFEMADETVDDLIERLQPICDSAKKTPIVILDYLQILPSKEDKTKREGLDDTLRKLKTFQRDTNTTFIVVSSFNRQNYSQQVSFESFKESGGLEYSADVVWGLQFYISSNIDDITRKKIEDAKREMPRRIMLRCLKNRNGRNYDLFFKYYPDVDTFEPCEESDLEDSIMTV